MNVYLIYMTVGVILLTVAYLFQDAKILKNKDTKGISVMFWYMISLGCTLTFINMLTKDTSTSVLIGQFINAFLALFTFGLVLRYRKGVLKDNPIIIQSLVGIIVFMTGWSMAFGFSNTMDIMQVFATITLLTSYIPAIGYIVKVKNSKDVSVGLFLTMAFGMILILTNYVATDTNGLIILQECVNIALLIVQVIVVIIYKPHQKTIATIK